MLNISMPVVLLLKSPIYNIQKILPNIQRNTEDRSKNYSARLKIPNAELSFTTDLLVCGERVGIIGYYLYMNRKL